MKERLEKLFFAIVRGLFFIVALGAVLAIIGSAIYLGKLLYDSSPKPIAKESYNPKDPNVTFDSFESFAKQVLQKQRDKKEHKVRYIVDIIKNGSSSHGYSIGNMPGGLIPEDHAHQVAVYITNGFEGRAPSGFGACSACHGEDAKGQNGQAPDLHALPIYNGTRSRVQQQSIQKHKQRYTPKQRSEYEKYIDRIVLLLNKYASKTGQPGVSREEISIFMQSEISKYNHAREVIFRQQFEDGIGGLELFSRTYQEFTKNLDVEIEPIKWQEYLKWFAGQFADQIASENSKLSEVESRNNEKESLARAKADLAAMKIMPTITFAGGALVVFLLATMLLVLIRIEYNTRKKSNENGDKQ